MIELALLTAAVAAACAGFGLIAGRVLDDDGAPLAVVIGRGLAVLVVLAAALDAAGAWTATARTAVGVAGIAAGAALLLRDRRWWPARSAERGSRAPAVIAVGLGTLAILSAAGDPHFAGISIHHAEGVQRALVAAGGAHSAHLADNGWGYALVLALVLALVPRDRALARTGILLMVAAKPLDGHDLAPQWIAVALVLTAFATHRRGHRLAAAAIAAVALGLAASSASPLYAALAIALAAAVIALIALAGDHEIARSCEDGEPTARGLAAATTALAIALTLCGVRATVGTPPSSWQSRTVHHIELAVQFATSH